MHGACHGKPPRHAPSLELGADAQPLRECPAAWRPDLKKRLLCGTSQEEAGLLQALRVVTGSDIIARIPPKLVGGRHGVRSRLMLHPEDERTPLTYRVDDPDDADLWPIMPGATHNCHAQYLGGETTNTLRRTVPMDFPWPLKPHFADVVSAAARNGRRAGGPRGRRAET